MSVIDRLTDFLTGESAQLVVLAFFLLLLLVLVIYRLILSLKREEKEAYMLREGYIPHEKLDFLRKERNLLLEQKRMDGLKRAALILSQDDQARLEDMDKQNAVLARKEIFLRNQLARREQQLNYMTEFNQLNQALGAAEIELSLQMDIAEGKPVEVQKKGLFKRKKKQ